MDVYYNMVDQMGKKSFLAETTANFTTTMKNDFTEKVDTSKFDFALNVGVNRKDEKALVEAKIDYSSNDLFNLKVLSTKDYIGIASEDILDKYIASKKDKLDDSISKASGLETDVSADTVDNALEDVSKNRIEMSDEYKAKKANEYSSAVYDLIPEEAVTEKEGVVATINSETINTNAYTLTLNTEQYKAVVKSILTKLKNDDELLGKIVVGEEKTSSKGTSKNIETTKEETEENEEPLRTITPINTQTIKDTTTEIVEGEVEEHETELRVTSIPQTDLVRAEDEAEDSNLEINSNIETDLVDDTSLDTTEIPKITIDSSEVIYDKKDNELYSDLAVALLLGRKIDGTVQDLKTKIDEELSNISSIENGIIITIYVREEEGKERETVKLVAELQEKTTFDIEYSGNTKFKATYLEPGEDEDGKEILVGTSVDVEKQTSDVNVKYNVQYSNIENKKVVSKTQIELQTNNANPSKGYKNNAIIKFNDSEGDFKVNIKNEIKFQDESVEEELTSENAIFVDELSNEEAEKLFEEIYQKVMTVYAEKLVSLDFIDNNSSNSVIGQPTVQPINVEEKEKAKTKLIETVSQMMGAAQERGEEFTIQNLVDLQIEGYEVSSIVSADLAIIKINGYTFNIDKDFMLSE